MKTLTIVRHAKSCWENADLHDMVRPLNGRGALSIPIVGNYLKQQNIHPDLVYTSPATRALHTAIGIGGILGCHPEDFQIDKAIYFGSVQTIIDLIKSTDNVYKDVFLFGHESNLSDIIYELSGYKPEKFPTCAAFRIRFESENWKTITKGTKTLFVYPKQLLKV